MALAELIQFLDEEKGKLFEAFTSLKGFYHTLLESARTLTVPFRNSFAPESNIKPALDPEQDKIVFIKHGLQSLEGEVQNNTDWLINILNNIFAIQNKYLQSPYFIELKDIDDIRKVHDDISKFLNHLYEHHLSAIPNAEMSLLARQKKNDIEDLLENHIDHFFKRMEQVKVDEYIIRLREEIKDQVGTLQNYYRSTEEFDQLIREKCTYLGLSYNPDLAKLTVTELESSDEALSKRIKSKYREATAEKALDPAGLRRRYLKIVYRYLSRNSEISKLIPILENIYYIYQPKPSLGERFSRFISKLFGKDVKLPKKDVEFQYIIAKGSIQRKKASLEDLMDRTNRLDKLLLKVKNHVNSYYIKKEINAFPLKTMRNIITNISTLMGESFDDCFGLIQWLGKMSNKEKLDKIPVSMQRDFNQYLNSIHATLIINSERLKDIARQFPDSR